MESRQGGARCLAQRLDCSRCFGAGDPGPEPWMGAVFTNHRGSQQPRGVAAASKGMQTS